MTFDDYAGPILVTVAYVFLYYIFMVHVLRVKLRLTREYAARGEKFDRYASGDREMLAADRTQLNMLEHMPPFLILLWLQAVFVGAFTATVAGGLYVASRAAYPLVLGARLGRRLPLRVLWVTVTGYAVLVYFTLSLLWTVV